MVSNIQYFGGDPAQVSLWFHYTRDGIVGHQFNKILESFAPCYLQIFIVPSTGGFERKPYSSMVLKIRTKFAKQENSSLFMISILWNIKIWIENQAKTRVWEDSSLCPEISTKNAVQEFHLNISGYRYLVTFCETKSRKDGFLRLKSVTRLYLRRKNWDHSLKTA